jgi:hypothetical protein
MRAATDLRGFTRIENQSLQHRGTREIQGNAPDSEVFLNCGFILEHYLIGHRFFLCKLLAFSTMGCGKLAADWCLRCDA